MFTRPLCFTGNADRLPECFEEVKMNLVTWKITCAFRALLAGEEGQDLVEYSMIAALLALGATASLGSVGLAINTIFGQLTTIIYVALG